MEPLNKSVTWILNPTRRSCEGRNLAPQRFRFLLPQELRGQGLLTVPSPSGGGLGWASPRWIQSCWKAGLHRHPGPLHQERGRIKRPCFRPSQVDIGMPGSIIISVNAGRQGNRIWATKVPKSPRSSSFRLRPESRQSGLVLQPAPKEPQKESVTRVKALAFIDLFRVSLTTNYQLSANSYQSINIPIY